MVTVGRGQKWDWTWKVRPRDLSLVALKVLLHRFENLPRSSLGQMSGPKVEEEASPQILFAFPLTDSPGTPDGIADVCSADLRAGFRKKSLEMLGKMQAGHLIGSGQP